MGKIVRSQKVRLISRVNYPVTIVYEGKEVVIANKASTPAVFDKSRLPYVNPKELMIR